jgi:hypothetical protein
MQAAPSLAYAELNLRRNPFGELEPWERAELALVDAEPYLRRLRRPGYAVQFVGDKGRGKTTHLLAIRRRLPGVSYVRIAEDGRTEIPAGSLLLVDEIQRLDRRRRRRLFRPERSLGLGTHEDFSRELRRAGLTVETVWVAAGLSASRVCAICNRRIAWARRGPGCLPEVTLEQAKLLLARFGDDLRAIEGHLYEWIQGMRNAHGEM